MSPIQHTESRSRGWRPPSVWVTVAVAAVVMTVLSTTASAAMTTTQRMHTGKFLDGFRSEYRALTVSWKGDDFCSWVGVTCSAVDNTVAVDLSGFGLVGKMPEIDDDVDGSQVRVTSINLSNNPGISDKFQSHWRSLTGLRVLDLSRTSLKGELPSDWQRMASLEHLNISRTSACHGLPRWSPSSMRSLKVVDFSQCNFRGSLQDSWAGFSLSVAHFEGNNFCGCMPSVWDRNSVMAAAMSAAQPALIASECAQVNQCGSDAGQCNAVLSAQENTHRFLLEFADEFKDQLRSVWTGTDHCAWRGVTCNTADGTVEVDLSGFDLKGNMPEVRDEIDGSKVLVTAVDLSNNRRLKGYFERDWGRLKQLRRLNVSNTALEGSLPSEWSGMASLEVLDVHNTVACRTLPDWALPKLRVVDLSSSSFYGSLRDSWSRMASLERVVLRGNSFCGCVPTSWRGVAALSNAVAADSGVNAALISADCATANACGWASSTCEKTSTGSPGSPGSANRDDTLLFLSKFADSLPGLRGNWTGTDYCYWQGVTCSADGTVAVNLSGRGLVGWMPKLDRDVVGANVITVSINLSGNPGIRGNFEDSWATLAQLQSLDLSGTSLYGNIPDSWNGMSSLQEVRIRNTAACRGLPKWNSYAMPNLRVVDFSNNNMAGSLSESWSTFSTLDSVSLSGNSFCGCVPSSWGPSLAAALGEGAAASSASCSWLNWCTSTSWRCNTVRNTNTGGSAGGSGSTGGAVKPAASDTLVFLRALSSALSLGWSGDDYCVFSGVTCVSQDGVQVASVDLSNRGLSSTYMPPVGNSIDGAGVFVARIDLSANPKIGGAFPESWAALKRLEVLDLSGTSLYGSIPDSWNGMSSLQEVRIRNTLACRSLPNWNGDSLSRLRVVDFRDNPNMRGVLTNSFATFTRLTSLDLRGNNFCGCVPDGWQWVPVLSAAAATAGVPTTQCGQNACRGQNFVCPTIQQPALPPPTEDPTLQMLRRIARALAVSIGGSSRLASDVDRATLPSGQTLEQNWTGDDYCSNWVGVTCDTDTGDIALNLSHVGLRGQLPSLESLEAKSVSLTSVDFSNNPNIDGTFPVSWGSLKGLRVLRLTNLGIASSLPKEWEGMSALQEVTVSNTLACGSVPNWDAASMLHLRAIDLSHNRLSGTLPASLGGFAASQLENFTLAGNAGICGCVPTSWTSAALLDGAASANNALTAINCAANTVACKSQAACRIAGANSGNGDGAMVSASTLCAWAVAACLALLALL